MIAIVMPAATAPAMLAAASASQRLERARSGAGSWMTAVVAVGSAVAS
jgi:hypothetical protein